MNTTKHVVVDVIYLLCISFQIFTQCLVIIISVCEDNKMFVLWVVLDYREHSSKDGSGGGGKKYMHVYMFVMISIRDHRNLKICFVTKSLLILICTIYLLCLGRPMIKYKITAKKLNRSILI